MVAKSTTERMKPWPKHGMSYHLSTRCRASHGIHPVILCEIPEKRVAKWRWKWDNPFLRFISTCRYVISSRKKKCLKESLEKQISSSGHWCCYKYLINYSISNLNGSAIKGDDFQSWNNDTQGSVNSEFVLIYPEISPYYPTRYNHIKSWYSPY